MKSCFKQTVLLALTLPLVGCFTFDWGQPDPPFIDEAQESLIRIFARENGYHDSLPISDFVEYLYEEWPNESKVRDYILTFPPQDTSKPRTLVLSDILTSIGKSLRVYNLRMGAVLHANIDSIKIRTDSVIIFPGLSLSDCNLTHLPPQIGKLRFQSLDLSYNRISTLPLEIMQLLDEPKVYPYTMIRFGGLPNFNYEALPDTLKEWFTEVYNKQDFPKQ